MNKPALKNFAISARLELLARVRDRAAFYGITEEKYRDKAIAPTEGFQRLDGVMLSSREAQQRNDLLARIRGKGYEQVMEEAAYTWFNRFIALRYMEEHRLLPMDARVLPEQPGLLPQLVREAQRVELDGIDRAEITAMLEENRTEELYKTLLIALCNQLSTSLPQMFEPIADYTELLFPDGILKAESVLGMLAALNRPGEDNWGDIQVIGWLYQYYITDINALVYDGSMAKNRIPKELLPAATQIFTPDWVVKYMIENSLGRLWLEGHPDHNIQDQWRYYLEEAKQEPEVEAKLAEIRRERASLQPEQITVLDPCMGSGHILVYAFDVLMTIYRAVGYTDRDAVQSIIENNLYGLDIDDRAAQLAYFALMMKACQYDRRFLRRGIQPHVCPIEPSQNIFAEDLACFGPLKQQALDLYHTFTDAKEYGSILTVPLTLEELRRLSDVCDDLLQQAKTNISFEIAAMQKSCAMAIQALIPQAKIMVQKYDIVITNPPYLGNSRFSNQLNKYVVDNYPEGKADLSTVMYLKAMNDFAKDNGFVSFITITSWMFLSSFEKYRNIVLKKQSIVNLVDFGSELFEGKVGHNLIAAWVARNTQTHSAMTAIRLVDYCYSRRDEKGKEFFEQRNRYTAQQDNFSKIPGAPVAYWVSEAFIEMFKFDTLTMIGSAKQGLITGDNGRFLRHWFEVLYSNIGFCKDTRMSALHSKKKWFPYCKGGEYRKWYGNNDYLVNWYNDGIEIQTFYDDKGKLRSRPQNLDTFFQQGVTWSDITSGTFSARFAETGTIHDSTGPKFFCKEAKAVIIVLAILNAKPAQEQLHLLAPTFHFREGPVSLVTFNSHLIHNESIVVLCNSCIFLSRTDWNSFETSWDFQRHPLI